MARLDPISAAQQFRAVAWLRWRLFANGFRRKGGTGEIVARIIVLPFAAVFVVLPVLGAGFGAYSAAHSDRLVYLTAIFWGIFALQILVSINISPPGLSFDPESLIRYPLAFPRYLTIRLFLGLLSASTIIGTLALIAAAAGVSFARPKLASIVFAAALALALCNMLFIRMVFAWIDRWLSTRRARELFTVLIFVFSIGIQYVNVTINGVGKHQSSAEKMAKYAAVARAYQHVEPYLHDLPPGLAGSAVLNQNLHASTMAALSIAGILAFAAVFLAIFAWRMQREYRGENLSEAARTLASQSPTQLKRPGAPSQTVPSSEVGLRPAPRSLLSPILAACFQKEWIYVRRNPAQFYGLIAPLAMVFIFAGRMGGLARSGMVFPAAAAYSVLGIAALAYNVLGLDASGVQFYFLAPVQLRTIFLAKNLFSFSITAIQFVLVYIVLLFTSGAPPLLVTISTSCWVVFACLVNATIGNMRSITAPKKIDPSKISRKQASQLSALMCVGIMAVIAALGVGIISLSRFAGIDWLPIPILLGFAIGAFVLYVAGLNRVDSMALNHRESLVEELSKAS
jgi:ABC-2 type transport system permease protein